MTFPNALSYLNDGRATKLSTWKGYIAREDEVNSSTGATIAILYTVVKLDGSAYRFKYTVSTKTYTYVGYKSSVTSSSDWSDETPYTMSALLFEAMLSNDWETGSAASYEAVRSGTGEY